MKIVRCQPADIPRALLLLADPSDDMVDSYLDRGDGFLACAIGVVVGGMVLLHTRPKTMELVNLAVDEAWQRRGIGSALIRAAQSHARAQGARTLELGTGSTGIGQIALYQRHGFRIAGVDADFFVRHYPEPIYENGRLLRDMVRMECRLDQSR